MLVITALALVVTSASGCRSYRGAPASAAATVGLESRRPGGLGSRATLTLGNGLRVVLEENHAAPVVAIQAWVHVGAADDPPRQAGLAHMFQHLLFLSTRSRPAGQVGREIAAIGGRIGAWTGYDQTVFHEVVASAFVELGLDVLADALGQTLLTAADVETARRRAKEDLRQTSVAPERVAAQAALATAFAGHPYGGSLMGTDASLAAITPDQVKSFFDQFYGAANTTLVIVGDFDPSVLRPRVEAAFGSWRSGTPAAPRSPVPDQLAPLVGVLTAEVSAPQLVVAFRIPDLRDPDAPALELLAAVLGPGRGGRLETEIVRNRQLASSPHAYLFNGRGVGLLVMTASLGPGRVDDAARVVIDEALRLSRDRIGSDELVQARTIVEGDGASDRASLQGYARRLGLFATLGEDPGLPAAYVDRLRAVDAGDLMDVAARTFRRENLIVAAVLPAARDPLRDDRTAKLATRLQAVAAASEARASAPVVGSQVLSSGRDVVVDYALPSGVRLLVLHDDAAEQLSVRAIWSGGVRFENERLSGATSLLARLLPRGTKTRSAARLASELGELAGNIDGIAGIDSLGLRGDFLASHWERGIEVVIDCLRNPKIAEEDVERERRVLLDAIRARDDDATEVALRLFGGALFGRHPYREDLLGTSDSVAGLNRRRLLDHYRQYYGPRGLTLAIVGPVDPDRVATKVQALFADAPIRKGARELPPAVPQPVRSERVEVFQFVTKVQARIVVGYPGLTVRDPDRFALEVLAEVLGGTGGRLATLREPRGLVEGITASSQEGVDPGYLAITVVARPESLDATVPALRAEIARVVDGGMTDEEVTRARRLLVGIRAVALERRGAVALALALHGAFGEAGRSYRRDVDELSKVTTADVVRVARKIIDSRREVLAIVRPRDSGRPAASLLERHPTNALR
jgi:zinc protease